MLSGWTIVVVTVTRVTWVEKRDVTLPGNAMITSNARTLTHPSSFLTLTDCV
jgi:hypothetical protein